MADANDIRDLRNAIGRGLSASLVVEHDTPEQLIELLRRLKRSEQSVRNETRDDR
jgi:hypothetical protein